MADAVGGLRLRTVLRRDSDSPLLPALLLAGLVTAAGVGALLMPEALRGEAALLAATLGVIAAYLAWPKPALLCFALLMLFSRSLGRWIAPELAQLDELAMPALVILAAIRTRPWRRGLIRPVRDGALAATFAVGVVSAVLAGVPPGVWLLGLLVLGKVFAFLYVVEWHGFSARDLAQVVPTVLLVALMVLVVGALEAVDPTRVRELLNLGPVGSEREGLPSIKSLLTHPGVFSWFAAFVALFLFAAHSVYRRPWMLLLAIAFSAATVLSARRRALAGLAAALVGGFAASVRARAGLPAAVRRWAPSVIALMLLGLVFLPSLAAIARSTVDETTNPNTQRVALISASIEIARDHFPLGVGLGRFGSAPSKDPYSPVYAQYGLDEIDGLSPESPTLVKDAFWARILGETGALGLGALAVFVAAVALSLWRAARRRYSTAMGAAFAMGAAMIFLQALIDTLASSLFDSPTRVYLLLGAVGAALALARDEPVLDA